MNFDYKLIETTGKDHQKYKELHNLLFKGAATSSEWIYWYHNQIGAIKNWSNGTRTWGVFDQEQLVGIWSVEPKNLKIGTEIMHVGRCFAVGIHEDYRRHGLFVALSEFAIEQEKNIAEYDYILGFPQVGRTVIGGHFKAGWEEVFDIDIYSLKNESRIFGPARSTINFTSDYTILNIQNGFDGIIEDADYNNLRYIKHPDHQYLTYNFKNGTIVLKTYGNFCHILDVSGPVENVTHLLNTVKSLAIKHGWIEVNAWCSSKEIYKSAFVAAGFTNGAEFGLPVKLIAVKINALKPLLIDDCTIQMGVEEGY